MDLQAEAGVGVWEELAPDSLPALSEGVQVAGSDDRLVGSSSTPVDGLHQSLDSHSVLKVSCLRNECLMCQVSMTVPVA